jgi:PAS domain S-box-containing protein
MVNPRLFENLILNISARFIGLQTDEIDEGINQALQELGQFMGADRSILFRFSSDMLAISDTHRWSAERVESQYEQGRAVPVSVMPWVKLLLTEGDVLYLPRICESIDGELDEKYRIPQALVAIPMIYQEEMIGFIEFEFTRKGKIWPEESIPLFRMLGIIFSNALKRKQSQTIQAGQRQFLELLATGADFFVILQKLVQIIEEQWPGMLGLVLLLDADGKHLHLGASKSLPQDYLESIEGLEIGPNVGSCGTASYLGERVIVEDILTDPRWDGLRELAMKQGLCACWSEPIISASGKVLGTFAMYYRHRRAPTAEELRTIEIGAHLAGVAIERKQADEALQESQRKLSTLISTLPGMAYRCKNDHDWTMEFVSEGSLDLSGYRPEELILSRKVSYSELVHPLDRNTVWDEVQIALNNDRPFQLTYRINTPAGEKWVWEQGKGVTNSAGEVIALEGFVTDITERVTAQQNLEQRVDERTRELSTLLDISHNLASMLDLEPLLDLILDQLGSVVSYAAASILILNQDILKILAYRGPVSREEALKITFSIHEAKANYEVIRQRTPVIIDDIRDEGTLSYPIWKIAGNELETLYKNLRCWMGIPLIVKDQVVGMLTLDHQQPGYYAATHAQLVMAFASQAAIAIENARLYQQAEQVAITHERNRLARDLHDAVTQTLFSASLIAEVLPKLWERNPEIGRQKLGELRLLTRGALSEMRTLLLELRPDTLAEVELVDLYRHLANAFTGRTRIPVGFTTEGHPVLPPLVKETFYRVGQEALNNIAKHSGASQVQIHLTGAEDRVEVSICDDGCGFEVSSLLPENLGLKIMRERAEAVCAQLGITCTRGAGTQIHLYWQFKEEN